MTFEFCFIKSFISPSNVIEPERQLYLAVRVQIYETFFQRKFITSAVVKYQLKLMIYDIQEEVIRQWL